MLSKTIPELEQEENLELAIYVKDERQSTIPEKENADNYVFDKATCFVNGKEDASVTVSWDSEAWAPIVKGLTTYKTRCDLYFKEASFNDMILACNKNSTASECFLENASLSAPSLAYDETADNNLRYVGTDPNNYVSFNNELWRIIGVMNNVDNGSGTKESRIKLVRNESIGDYSYDTGHMRGYSSNYGESDIMTTLNEGPYWNRVSGTCLEQVGGAINPPHSITCDFSNTGLMENSKSFIEDAIWNLGPVTSGTLKSKVYAMERSSDSSTWTGKIGLLSASDVLFAIDPSVDECQEFEIPVDTKNTCGGKSYFHSGMGGYSLTMWSDTNTYVLDSLVWPGGSPVWASHHITPTVYLKSSVRITSGTGSVDDPYILSL